MAWENKPTAHRTWNSENAMAMDWPNIKDAKNSNHSADTPVKHKRKKIKGKSVPFSRDGESRGVLSGYASL